MEISVIVCTHNPKQTTFERVLQALKLQDLPTKYWELIVVDNASKMTLSEYHSLQWHPNGKHVREDKIGLTAARVCGIRESIGDLIVFVDDDNILSNDYLSNAKMIGEKYPFIGAWGGIILPEFEKEPPAWIKPHYPILALRDFKKDIWSNLNTPYETAPAGAGMCVRRQVAQKYLELITINALRSRLDRIGDSLSSCGDSDLALTSCDIGMGTGQFTSLKMYHVIPESRLSEDYLLKLSEGLAYSQVILATIRGYRDFFLNEESLFQRLGRFLILGYRERKFYLAKMRGRNKALRLLANLNRERT